MREKFLVTLESATKVDLDAIAARQGISRGLLVSLLIEQFVEAANLEAALADEFLKERGYDPRKAKTKARPRGELNRQGRSGLGRSRVRRYSRVPKLAGQ